MLKCAKFYVTFSNRGRNHAWELTPHTAVGTPNPLCLSPLPCFAYSVTLTAAVYINNAISGFERNKMHATLHYIV